MKKVLCDGFEGFKTGVFGVVVVEIRPVLGTVDKEMVWASPRQDEWLAGTPRYSAA